MIFKCINGYFGVIWRISVLVAKKAATTCPELSGKAPKHQIPTKLLYLLT
jgi:hypothetical protein